MTRSHAAFALHACFAVGLGLACSPDPLSAPPPSSGGSAGTGATGGASASGGSGNVAGGPPQTGGSGNVGGSAGKGGASGASGSVAAGGSAGTLATGGTAGTGSGGTGTAGTGTAGTGTAGTAGTGTAGTGTAGTGTGGTAGAGAICDAPWDVNSSGFVRAQAMGGACWSGYAFAGADMLGSTAAPTNFEMCPTTPCELCFAGTVIMDADYASTAYIGFNIGQPASGGAGGSVVPTGTGLRVTFSNGTGTPLRLQIANGDSAAQRWCADITTSPAQVPYTSFNTTCWEPTTGTAYAKTAIKAIQIIVPGDAAEDRPFDVCINSVAEY